MKSAIVDVRGAAVPVARGGRGPAVLWLHGEGLSTGWRAVHDALAARYDVIVPTLPGFGSTEMPDWLDDMDDLALFVADLVSALDLDRTAVIGESLGGWLALSYAIWRPSAVGALGLIAPLGHKPAEQTPDLFLMDGPKVLAHLANSIDGAQVDPLTGDAEAATAMWVEQATQARLMWERPYDRRFARRVHHLTCPIRVVWGTADRAVPVANATLVAKLVGAPAPVLINGAGHLASLDAPDAVAEALFDLERNDATPSGADSAELTNEDAQRS